MALRFGLLGTGYWAQATHAAALAADRDVAFVGVWGRNVAKVEAVAERFGVDAYSDLDRLIAAVDAIAIAVPPDVQARLAARAALAGRHLLLDKPLALSLAQADEVVAAADRSGVSSLVFFTARFVPEVDHWLREAQSVGEWHGARATAFGSIIAPGSPYGQSEWRWREGALWDVGPHALAMVLPLLGRVEQVTAAPGLGDTVHLILRHESGASSTLSLSLTVPPAAATSEFAVYGPPGFSAMPSSGTSPVHAFREAIAQLRACVEAGSTSHPCDVRFGREVVAVLEAASSVLDAPAEDRMAPVSY